MCLLCSLREVLKDHTRKWWTSTTKVISSLSGPVASFPSDLENYGRRGESSMLFSMFVEPRVVSPEVVNNRDARRNVERLLRAVVENGVLIGGDSLNLVRQFISNTEQL